MPTIVPFSRKGNPDLIAMLEDKLARAKVGEIDGAIMVCTLATVEDGCRIIEASSGMKNIYELIGYMQSMSFSLLRQSAENSRPLDPVPEPPEDLVT